MIEAPEETFARSGSATAGSGKAGPRKTGPRRSATEPRLRRDLAEDFAGSSPEQDGGYGQRKSAGLRLTLAGGMPTGKWGRVALGVTALLIVGALAVGEHMAKQAMLRDPRFVLTHPSAISLEGNRNVTPAAMLSIFSEDVNRSIFRVPLDERRAELEQIPWVKRATVMRLLPDHLRVLVTERTPVAFVREGGHIALVDNEGVLLEMGSNPEADGRYSFPVVTGIRAEDPLSTRRARMRIVEEFTSDLDSAGEKISSKLSEVDVSNPEDVKALIPESGSDVLVHFGDTDYLKRYRAFAEHLPEWRTQYPKLWSVDMRYERQVVLEMQPGTSVPLTGAAGPAAETALPEKPKSAPGAGKGRLEATTKTASPARPGVKPASATKPAPAAKTSTPQATKPGAKKAPQLVGQWTADGKYHAPAGGKP